MGCYLRPELIMDVLNHLPARARAVFRCVCKSWSTIFSRRPLNPSTNVCVFSHLDDSSPRPSIARFSSYDMQGNLIKHFDKKFHSTVDLVCTCLDYVCLVNNVDNIVYLCNPTTQELITLPNINGKIRNVGFGYVPSTKEFKVFCIFGSNTVPDNGYEVLTVGKDDQWRAAKDPPFPVSVLGQATFANEAIQLLPDRAERGGIASFYLEREEWGQVALPSIYYYSNEGCVVLRELRGCLCMVVMYRNPGHKMEIWLFKELMWVREYSFNLPVILKAICHLRGSLGPITVDDDGSLLLMLTNEEDEPEINFIVKCNSKEVVEVKALAKERVILWEKFVP